jgi:amidohydrolase
MLKAICISAFFIFLQLVSQAQPKKLLEVLDADTKNIEQQAIEWRRYLHAHPELSNREEKTAEFIAAQLRSFGVQVRTGIAHTGVVGILDSGKPGPVIGLRADIDALPVTERTDVPFASKVKTTYNGIETGVMHACGHDAHTAILLSVAKILSGEKDKLRGKVKFVFQPAEEGAPEGEEGGARLMVKEGVMENPHIDVMFGLHVISNMPVGYIFYKPGGIMAAADGLYIRVKGVGSHGSAPWSGIDPIVVSAQIIDGLQTIVSRQMNLTNEAAVITVGMIRGGIRNNIIPEEVTMIGTIRTLDTAMQHDIHKRIIRTAEMIAQSAGATATVKIPEGYPLTYNNPGLTSRAAAVLKNTFGNDRVKLTKAMTGAEDFSFYALKVPGFYYLVGACPANRDPKTAPAHHTPDFFIDEGAIKTGIKAMLHLTVDYMYHPEIPDL